MPEQEKRAIMAPLEVPAELKDRIFEAAARQRLSVAEWTRRTLARRLRFSLKKGA